MRRSVSCRYCYRRCAARTAGRTWLFWFRYQNFHTLIFFINKAIIFWTFFYRLKLFWTQFFCCYCCLSKSFGSGRFCLQSIFSSLSFLYSGFDPVYRRLILPFHIFGGTANFVLCATVAISGITEKAFFSLSVFILFLSKN